MRYVSQLDTEITLHKLACLDSKSPASKCEDAPWFCRKMKNWYSCEMTKKRNEQYDCHIGKCKALVNSIQS